MIRHTVRTAVFTVYVMLVLAATLAPLSGDMYSAVSGLDKLVHVGLFAGVAFLLYWSQKSTGEPSPVSAVGPTTILAGLVEIFQAMLGYRSGDFWDFIAGALGAVIGAGSAYAAAKLKHRYLSRP